MPTLDRAAVHTGRVRGRYYRENFAQGGIDLVQIVPELVTNADAAIAAGGRGRGRIELRFGSPEPGFIARWRSELERLRVPALMTWRHEVRCLDDGEGVDARAVESRLGALGVEPPRGGQRGLFGRGLRDVWLAQGGGRIEGIRGDRAVESWFFPAAGDDPYAFVHVRDEPATGALRRELGIESSGTRATVPLALARLPSNGRLRALVSQLVQLRPVLEDASRELWLELPGESLHLVTHAGPEPDPQRPVLYDDTVKVAEGIEARIVVRRAAEPLTLGLSRATRRSGLVVRSGRAAHEATLAGQEGRPGARHLFGEVWCEALEDLQRAALDAPRPQVVVKVDRSGLNEHHPVVRRLHESIDRILGPIVAAEERRAGAHLMATTRAVTVRDEAGLQALNEALRTAFDAPGAAGFQAGGRPTAKAPVIERETDEGDGETRTGPDGHELGPEPAPSATAMRFKQSPIRLHPGGTRTVSLLFDPARVPPGSSVSVETDDGLRLKLWSDVVPEPGARGWSRLSGSLRARVSVQPGVRLAALAAAGEETAELEVLVVRHTGSGWVREIGRKDEDAIVEGHFDPESGIVTVYEGRREFRELAAAARRAGFSKRRAPEYVPFRMLEVEVAANAVYAWASERILERRLAEERPRDPSDYAAAVYHEAQALRHRFHHRLMRAFLDPDVFEGAVTLRDTVQTRRRGSAQLRLAGAGDEPARRS